MASSLVDLNHRHLAFALDLTFVVAQFALVVQGLLVVKLIPVIPLTGVVVQHFLLPALAALVALRIHHSILLPEIPLLNRLLQVIIAVILLGQVIVILRPVGRAKVPP